MADKVTVIAEIAAPVAKVWDYYTQPEHIVQWNSAGEGWHTPRATNDLRVGGTFVSRMEPADAPKHGFDFSGTYSAVEEHKLIQYTMTPEDPNSSEELRAVTVTFAEQDGKTIVTVVFDAEAENTLELQQEGWQAILNNFKAHVEGESA